MTEHPLHDTFSLPPIPLATGVSLQDVDGTRLSIAGVSLVIDTDCNQTRTIPLTRKFGAWWVPGGAGVPNLPISDEAKAIIGV